MRFINIFTGKLEEFNEHRSPRPLEYAILSHVWGSDEILFSDMTHETKPHKFRPPPLNEDLLSMDENEWSARFWGCHGHSVKAKEGYSKLLHCCRQAFRKKLEYVWIDTCCIDKSSSSELSESINSAYLHALNQHGELNH
jgi:hypothetical protein